MNFWDVGSRIAQAIILPGQVSQQKIRLWYAAADIGIIPSYSEQCSYAALEMMNAGLPIVASNGNGLCDMFVDGVDAYVARVGNVEHMQKYAIRLAKQIERALNASNIERRMMKVASRKKLLTKYSANVMAKNYLDLFQSLYED